ncbi:hypothetical protein C8Q69DRAFT_242834 [Paecilomyces variotii]|uniref:Uncharacterized protein n=1 Tax=Byssochlamys spectabilis TaxID=264951 RepID=A0A443HX15_BYSSP|nr:hypothetical protein C8Q69DRAFT_242834 [Paecilomyces variotii]RWQ96376.1 hypothetical protein C8Q69DRAFT_242834 [Paecilomyces variotii]
MEDRNIHRQHHNTKRGINPSGSNCPETPLSPRSQQSFEYQLEAVPILHSLPQSQSPSPSTISVADRIAHISEELPSSNKENLNIASGDICHPAFFHAVKHLSSPLAPLVSITTGLPHRDFPRTLLAYHLLTSDQLDDIARHYHQVWPPMPETFGYPIRVPAWVGTGREYELDIETKRRRLGRFMGLRGCESPVVDNAHTENWQREACAWESDEEMKERMEREWQAALLCARSQDSDEVLRKKAGGF